MSEERKEPEVKVVDRRVSSAAEGKDESTARPAAAEATGEAAKTGSESACGPLPEIDFVTFILSLSTNAMVSLGLLPRPDGGGKSTDLPLARQTIDIIAMLQEKTRGNLTGEEERILDSVLYDLRMTYVRVAQGRC